MKKVIIFTDLDGTLLDYITYSFEKALPALQLVRERDIPLIICSSKTAKEVIFYRERLENEHPFISENGGGIFIPKDYFKSEIRNSRPGESPEETKSEIIEEGNYLVIRLGATYADLRKTLEALRKEGFSVRGFGDMTVQEIADTAHLDSAEAELAKERDFDEPFTFEGTGEETRRLFEAITARGFHYTKGEFFHILGNTDKGKAVSILMNLYTKEFGEMTSVALGDSPNDIPMLELVDYPIIVQRPNETYAISRNIPNLRRIDAIGSAGWNKAIFELLSDRGDD
jgi:mannosyl-3-phosphoglycerate phosphatase